MCYFSFSRLASILLNESYPMHPLAVFFYISSPVKLKDFSEMLSRWYNLDCLFPWRGNNSSKNQAIAFFFFLISDNVSDPKDVLKWWLQLHCTSSPHTLRAEGSIRALERSCALLTTRPWQWALGQLTLWALTLGGRCLSRVPALYLPAHRLLGLRWGNPGIRAPGDTQRVEDN